MNPMKRLCRRLDLISEWTGRIVGWLIVPLTVLILFEILTRRFLGKPTIWTFEISKFIYAGHFMLAIGYTLLHKAHVSVDAITVHLSPRTQAILNIITYIIFLFLFAVVMIWQGTIFAATSWKLRETSWSVFHPPLYPIKTVMPITGGLLLLQGISDFIKNIIFLVKGKRI